MKKIVYIVPVILIVVVVSIILSVDRTAVSYVDPSYAFDVSDQVLLLEEYENVFVGIVDELLIPDEIAKGIPATYYEVSVLLNIRGDANEHIILKNRGGYTDDDTLVIFEGDFLPEVGSTYIFITAEIDYDSNFEGEMYVVASPYQKIEIAKDYEFYEIDSSEIAKVISNIEVSTLAD